MPLRAQEASTSGIMLEDSPTLGAGGAEFSSTYSDHLPDGSFGIIVVPDGDYRVRRQCYAFGAAFGLRDGIDLLTEVQYCANSRGEPAPARVSGFGDLRMGLKVALWQPGTATSISWINAVTLPVLRAHPDEELSPGSRAMGTDQLLVFSHAAAAASATLQAGLHYGYDAGAGPEAILHLACGGGVQLTGALQPRLELHAERSLRTGGFSMAATAGAILSLSEILRLDVGLQCVAGGAAAWREHTLLARCVVTP